LKRCLNSFKYFLINFYEIIFPLLYHIKISPLEIIIRKDNRPYWLKKLVTKIVKIYVRQFLEPQFDYLGKGGAYFKPRYIKVFGGNVSIDDYPTLIGAKDAHIQFTSWDIGEHKGEIKIGKFCLITPGVRIMAAKKISIGRMNKFKEENALMTQAWVMEPKKKVQDIIKELSITDLKIKEFSRIKIGE